MESRVDLSSLSEDDRVDLGLRLRLKHIRLALAEVAAGRVPEGFDFCATESAGAMLAQLRGLEDEVLAILDRRGTGDPGSLN